MTNSSRRSATSPEAKSALGTASTSSTMNVDAVRLHKGNGKCKCKGMDEANDKKKHSEDTDASKTEETTCFYCGKLRHGKLECWKLTADSIKSTWEGMPHNINELGAAGSGRFTSCSTAGFSVDGVRTRSRIAGLHLDADAACDLRAR